MECEAPHNDELKATKAPSRWGASNGRKVTT